MRAAGASSGQIAGVAADEPSVRSALEQAYRDAARLSPVVADRVVLVDKANAVRPFSLL